MLNENWTPRAILAYFWSVVTAFLLYYILRNWGQEKEILTLVIGLIGGTILGGVFGVYFGASHKVPLSDQKTTTEITADSTVITQEPAMSNEAKTKTQTDEKTT